VPSLEITTMVGCPLMCCFCPQDKLRTAYGDKTKYLSLNDFAHMLAKVPRHVRIDFSGMSEPWANPECTAMLRHTYDQGYTVAIYTTLYGMDDHNAVIGLVRDRAQQTEIVVIHLPDAKNNMRGYKPSREFDQALDNFVQFAREGRVRVDMMTMDGTSQVHPTLKHHPDLQEWYPCSRSDNIKQDDVGAQALPTIHHAGFSLGCSYTPHYDQNVLLPNGDVLLCCMDYGSEHVLGNLMTQDYYDLFRGAGMGQIHAENLKTDGCSICRRCDRATRYGIGGSKQRWEAIP